MFAGKRVWPRCCLSGSKIGWPSSTSGGPRDLRPRSSSLATGVVDRRYLGRVLDRATAAELAATGVDACGENGEFHTVVTAGPLFQRQLHLDLGEQILRSGCWFQDLAVNTARPAQQCSGNNLEKLAATGNGQGSQGYNALEVRRHLPA